MTSKMKMLCPQNRRDNTSHHITQSQNKRTNDNRQSHIAFVEQVIEIQFRGQFVEGDVSDDDEEYRYDAERDRRDEVAQEEVREVHLHRFKGGRASALPLHFV